MYITTQALVSLLLCTAAFATRLYGLEGGHHLQSASFAKRFLLDTPPGATGTGNATTAAGLANSTTPQLYTGSTPPVDINISATAPSLFGLPTRTIPGTPSTPTTTSVPATGSGTGSTPSQRAGSPNPDMPSGTPKPTPTDKGSAPAAAKGINSSKAYPNGTTCAIAGTTIPSCGSLQPIPACCTSRKSSAQCVSFDSGDSVNCPNSVPFPACCEARPQPLTVCVRPDSMTGFCHANHPVPACCDPKAGQCNVFPDGSDVSCDPGFYAGCCPA